MEKSEQFRATFHTTWLYIPFDTVRMNDGKYRISSTNIRAYKYVFNVNRLLVDCWCKLSSSLIIDHMVNVWVARSEQRARSWWYSGYKISPFAFNMRRCAHSHRLYNIARTLHKIINENRDLQPPPGQSHHPFLTSLTGLNFISFHGSKPSGYLSRLPHDISPSRPVTHSTYARRGKTKRFATALWQIPRQNSYVFLQLFTSLTSPANRPSYYILIHLYIIILADFGMTFTAVYSIRRYVLLPSRIQKTGVTWRNHHISIFHFVTELSIDFPFNIHVKRLILHGSSIFFRFICNEVTLKSSIRQVTPATNSPGLSKPESWEIHFLNFSTVSSRYRKTLQ